MRPDKRRRKRADRKGRRAVHAQEDEPRRRPHPSRRPTPKPVAETPVEPRPSEPAPAAGELPMSGVRVIDVGNFLAGPYAASIMGEFGAEVLKVEHPIAGDPMRRFGTADQAPRRDPRLAVGGAQQEVGDHRPAAEARRRAVHPAGRQVGRAGRELPPRHDGGVGPRLAGAAARPTPAWSCCASPATARPGPTAAAPASRTSRTPSAASPISRAFPARRRWFPAPRRSATTSPASTA